MNGARPCVTSLAALVHMEGEWVPGEEGRRWSERGAVGGVGGWVDGETLGGARGREGRGGYMTQHIDLSLVGRVCVVEELTEEEEDGGKEGRNKIYAIRQIYALLGFLDAHGFTRGLYVVASRSCGGGRDDGGWIVPV